MSYLVRAEVEKPGSGTFTTRFNNKRDAIEKAQGLRSQGLLVCITDPQGHPVDEAADKVDAAQPPTTPARD